MNVGVNSKNCYLELEVEELQIMFRSQMPISQRNVTVILQISYHKLFRISITLVA